MAAGPLQKLTPGKPLEYLDAATWNRFGNATRVVEGMRVKPDAKSFAGFAEARFAKLANATGARRLPFQIVHYDDHALTELPTETTDFPERDIPVANALSPEAGKRFGILANEVGSSADNLVDAQVSGLAYVLVDIKDADDKVCGPVDDLYTHLESGTGGTPILKKALAAEEGEAALGVQWCVVLLDTEAVGDSLIAKIETSIDARVGDVYGAATVDLGHADSGTWELVLADQSVLNTALSPIHVPSGKTIHIVANKVRGAWVLGGPHDPHQANGFDESKDQSLGHDADEFAIEMQDDGAC